MHARIRFTHGCSVALLSALLLSGIANAQDELATTVDDSLDAAVEILGDNDPAAAEAMARRVLARIPEERPLLRARALQIVVETMVRAGSFNTDECLAMSRECLALRRDNLSAGDPDIADAYYYLGDLLARRGTVEEGVENMERALELFEAAQGPDHKNVVRTRVQIGQHLVFSYGDLERARELLEAAVESAERSGNDDGLMKAEYGLAVLAYNETHLDEAEIHALRAVEVGERIHGRSHSFVADAYNVLGHVQEANHDYAGGLASKQIALEIDIALKGPDHPSVGIMHQSVGLTQSQMGRYVEARENLERGVEILEPRYGPEHPRTLQAKMVLAATLDIMGDPDAALPILEEVLAAQEETLGEVHLAVAETTQRLGDLHLWEDRLDEAEAYFLRTLAIREELMGPDDVLIGKCHSDLGDLRVRQGDDEAARREYELAYEIWAEGYGPDARLSCVVERHIGDIDLRNGDLEAARVRYERSAKNLRAKLGPSHRITSNAMDRLARIEFAEGNLSESVDHAIEASRISRDHIRSLARGYEEEMAIATIRKRDRQIGLMLSIATYQGLDPTDVARIWDTVQDARGIVFEEMIARRRVLRERGDAELDELRAEYGRVSTDLAELATSSDDDDRDARIEAAQARRVEIERRLAAKSAEFRRQHERDQSHLADILEALPADTALLSFVHYDDRNLRPPGHEGRHPRREAVEHYGAFVATAGSHTVSVFALGEAEGIDAAVAVWREEMSFPTEQEREKSRRLRRLVFDPVRDALGDAAQVFVVPDGALHFVNFAALALDDDDYLLQRGPLFHFLNSESDLLSPPAEEEGRGVLAVGDPDYDADCRQLGIELAAAETARSEPIVLASASFRGDRAGCRSLRGAAFAPLEATGREAQRVVEIAREYEPVGSVELFGGAANEAAFKRLAPGRAVLHLATHGFFLRDDCEGDVPGTRAIGGLKPREDELEVEIDNPLLLSGLALAGVNTRSQAGPEDEDGVLTAEEVSMLELAGTRWAVLSACDSGSGAALEGEGVFGLRRAFQLAGVRSVIMSFWTVGDESTREWMEALYEARYQRGRSTAEAVREASLRRYDALRDEGRSTHPRHWGAFVAAGDWR